jgi:hypothetical protein
MAHEARDTLKAALGARLRGSLESRTECRSSRFGLKALRGADLGAYLDQAPHALAVDHRVSASRRDFVLRGADTEILARPGDPKAVASTLQKTAGSDREVTLYPSVGIGYESGPRVYDPVTGEQRGGGLRTAAGMGVGVGSSQVGTTDQDRRTMELELMEKGLPEGKTSKSVAGYLYFLLKAKKKSAAYRLELVTGHEPIRLELSTEPAAK